jgi:hypothetical protein
MASKPKATLVATAPDGTEVRFRTAAGYDWAGIVQRRSGEWVLLAKGWAYASVEDRTRRAWRSAGGWDTQQGWSIVRVRVSRDTGGGLVMAKDIKQGDMVWVCSRSAEPQMRKILKVGRSYAYAERNLEGFRLSDGRSKDGFAWLLTVAEMDEQQRRKVAVDALHDAGLSLRGTADVPSLALLEALAATVAEHQRAEVGDS